MRLHHPGAFTRVALAIAGVAAPVALLLLPTAHAATAADRRPIRTLYLADCAVCHGADARGSHKGPSLADAGAAGVDFWVSTGRMPLSSPDEQPARHPPRYSPSRIRALVAYVTALTGNAEPAVPSGDTAGADVADGATQYRLNCAACHAASGVGGALFRREAPKVTSASEVQIAEAIRTGPGQMPAFGRAALDERQLRDTVAYTHGLAHPDDRGGLPLWHLGPLAEGGAVAALGLVPLVVAVRWIGTRR